MFITFEGADGVGKTTQSKLFTDWLQSKGHRAIWVREPGGTEEAEKLREIIKYGGLGQLGEVMCLQAARAECVEKVIMPKLAEGVWVVCDRYIDSTMAYQGYGRGNSAQMLYKLNQWSTDGLMPDVTILIDAMPEMSQERLSKAQGEDGRGDTFDGLGLEFQHRVRDGFLSEMAHGPNPRRWVMVRDDGETSVDRMQGAVRRAFTKKLVERGLTF